MRGTGLWPLRAPGAGKDQGPQGACGAGELSYPAKQVGKKPTIAFQFPVFSFSLLECTEQRREGERKTEELWKKGWHGKHPIDGRDQLLGRYWGNCQQKFSQAPLIITPSSTVSLSKMITKAATFTLKAEGVSKE